MRNIMAVSLCCLLSMPASAMAASTADVQPSIQEQLLEIPAGSPVEVRLKSKSKLRGRLGEIVTDGFALQIAKGNQTVTEQIAFANVKSLKQINTGTGKGTHMLAGIGLMFVGLVVLNAIIYAVAGGA